MISTGKAYHLLMGFLMLFSIINAQDQRVADSLRLIYEADTLQGISKLENLKELAFNEINDSDLSLLYAEKLITLAETGKEIDYLAKGYYQKGNALRTKGNLETAIQAYFKSAEIAKKAVNKGLEGSAYGAIADIYSVSEDHENSSIYYQKSIETLKETEDTTALAVFIMNYGYDLFDNEKYDLALNQFEHSGKLFEDINYIVGKAYNLGNIGMVYAKQGRNKEAEDNINEAINILEDYEDFYAISEYLLSTTDIYVEKEEHKTAIEYAHRSLSLAEQYQLREQIADANIKLAELYELIGDLASAYVHYKNHILHRDSLLNIEKVQELANQRTNFEVSQKQVEVELLETKTRNQLIILGFVGISFLASLWFYRTISKEKKKSEELLLNILPEDTAKELKINGSVKAKKYESVTVFFSDFKGFTSYSEKLSPEDLVETVSFYFSKFDEIIYKHGLEKIKTIGDAYMCASGIHGNEKNHAQKMIHAAFEIVDFVASSKGKESDKSNFDIRIGINSGPVVAGVVGTKKFAYDIWGDTVNVASRMESASEIGKINISEYTYELVKNDFECTYRGEIEVKNKGAMKMYFVNGITKNPINQKTAALHAN
jgi:class 3 adenylate cyclase/Tfp pilus assembly protein PilF